VERDLATFLAAGVLMRDDSQALRAAVNQLCSALAADRAALALRLCEGFAIPDHLLAAPIAFDWERM
jgi:acyl-CoA oxidase